MGVLEVEIDPGDFRKVGCGGYSPATTGRLWIEIDPGVWVKEACDDDLTATLIFADDFDRSTSTVTVTDSFTSFTGWTVYNGTATASGGVASITGYGGESYSPTVVWKTEGGDGVLTLDVANDGATGGIAFWINTANPKDHFWVNGNGLYYHSPTSNTSNLLVPWGPFTGGTYRIVLYNGTVDVYRNGVWLGAFSNNGPLGSGITGIGFRTQYTSDPSTTWGNLQWETITTPAVANGWTLVQTTATLVWKIVDGAARATSGEGFILRDVATSDFDMSCVARSVTFENNTGVIFRYIDASNYLVWDRQDIFSVVGGVSTLYSDSTLPSGTPTWAEGDTLRIVGVGDRLDFYVNGTTIGYVISSANQTGTKFGFLSSYQYPRRFDDFSISHPVPPAHPLKIEDPANPGSWITVACMVSV